MSETIVILDKQGFRLRISGMWHHGLSREQSRRLLLAAGIDDHDAYILLDSAVWWPEPSQVAYTPVGRRHWRLNGRAVNQQGATWEFRQTGMKHDEIAHVLRTIRLCFEIEARLPPPPPERVTVDEFRRLLLGELAHALTLRLARYWAEKHLLPARSKHRRNLAGWMQRFERDKPNRRISPDDFAQVLKDAGIKVVGDAVYCKEIRS